jgi:hypothetical protein
MTRGVLLIIIKRIATAVVPAIIVGSLLSACAGSGAVPLENSLTKDAEDANTDPRLGDVYIFDLNGSTVYIRCYGTRLITVTDGHNSGGVDSEPNAPECQP